MKIRRYADSDWEAIKEIYNLSKPDANNQIRFLGSDFMAHTGVRLRAALPTLGDGRAFARYLDQAAEGVFRFMLGPRFVEIIANAFLQRGHDMSYQYVTFAEHHHTVVGMFSGYTGEQHSRSSDHPLRQAAGKSKFRMMVVSLLLAPMLRMLDTVASGDFYLQAIAIDPELRGKGLGTALLNTVEEAARGCGAHRLSLDVSAGNKGALALYQRRGMQIETRWPKRWTIAGFKFYRMTKSL